MFSALLGVPGLLGTPALTKQGRKKKKKKKHLKHVYQDKELTDMEQNLDMSMAVCVFR